MRLCFWCEGSGKREQYVRRLRRRALVACDKCAGEGLLGESRSCPDEVAS